MSTPADVTTVRQRELERRRAEKALGERETPLREAIRASGTGSWDWDLRTNTVTYSLEWKAQLGYRDEEIGERLEEWQSRLHPDDREAAIAQVRAYIDDPSAVYEAEFRLRHRDGGYRCILSRGSLARDQDGRPCRMIAFNLDITERRTAEEALRLRDRAIAAVSQGILITDATRPHNPIIFANSGFEWMTGYAAAEVLGRSCRFLQGEETDPAAAERLRAAIERGAAWSEEILNYRKDRRPFWNLVTVSPIRDDSGRVTHFVGVQNDVTQRRKSDLALKESEARYRVLFEASPFPTWIYDPSDLKILAVNDAALEQYGYERQEMLTLTMRDLQAPEELDRLARTLRGLSRGRHDTGEWHHRTKAGRALEVNVYTDEAVLGGRTVRLVIVRDVTQQKILEEQFRQAQKMEAIGQLAGSVAHDFNNLLTVISGYAELLLQSLEKDAPSRAYATEIALAGERAITATKQLLAFSRKQVLEPRVLDLSAIVTGMRPLLPRLVGEDVELLFKLEEGLGLVRADPGQIEQVVMNLVVNARDAMPAGGKLTVETRDVEVDETFTGAHPSIQPGPYVTLAVTDTGIGMDAATLSHIFEPFFTTKEKGKGTGLGLATVFGIVTQSGGDIVVDSEPGAGTTFRIFLPHAKGENSHPTERPASGVWPALQVETILLVEDDEPVRQLTQAMLESLGYRVLATSGAEEALEVAARPEPINVLMADVIMPRISGPQLADRLSALRPEIRVLFVSGYPDEVLIRRNVLRVGAPFLQKPFSPVSLSRRLHEILEGRRSAVSPD